MKEKPILFSAAMVQAIIDGRKTETRRMNGLKDINENPNEWEVVKTFIKVGKGFTVLFYNNVTRKEILITCAFGQEGDLLWVRERWRIDQPEPEHIRFQYIDDVTGVDVPDGEAYKYTNYERWRPSIHMPKYAARIWIENTCISVERLQDITEERAIVEGVYKSELEDMTDSYYKVYTQVNGWTNSAKQSFISLWCKINGADSWEANPWVWVIKYKVLSTTGKPIIAEHAL